MKYVSILFFLLIGSYGVLRAQQTTPENIAGTHVSLVLPAGFTQSSQFAGAEGPDDSGILVMEIPGSYYQVANSLTKETLEGKGATVHSFEETKIQQYNAKLATMTATDGSINVILAFGDESFTVMLTGLSGKGGEAIIPRIKSALLSATIDTDIEVDPLASAWFILDDSDSRLKFNDSAMSMYVYTIDGKDNSDKEPFLMAVQVPGEGVTDLAAFSEGVKLSLESKGLTGIDYSHERKMTLNGYNAYETIGSGVIKGEPLVLMMQLIQHENRILLIQGMFKGDLQSFDAELVRELTNTVQFKD